MPGIELRGQQTEGGDERHVRPVPHCDKVVGCALVQQRDGAVVPGIDFLDPGVFVNDLRLVIAHAGKFVRDLVEGLPAHDDADGLLPAEAHAAEVEGMRFPAAIRKRIERERDDLRAPAGRLGHEGSRDRYLVDAVFGQRDADGVADAVGEQRADADGAFDAGVFTVSGFGYAEVDGVIPVGAFGRQAGGEESVGVDHHLRVARLHREDEGMKIHLARDTGELERALDHAERRVAVAVHDPVAQGAVIGPDADADAALFAKLDQRREPAPYALQFGGVLVVGIFAHQEFLGIGVVAGIDADFLDPQGGFHRRLGLEMDGRDDGDVAPFGQEGFLDELQVLRVLHGGRGDADDLATHGGEVERLLDARGGVHGVACQHRLDADRVGAADADFAGADFARYPALAKRRVHAIWAGFAAVARP